MTKIYTVSPVMDFTNESVWQLMSACNWEYADIYDKLYKAGIEIADQRVGNLLHQCGIKNISMVKAMEPDLYAKIISRFNNVEFISQFSKSGYFKIGKPKPTDWDGYNHVKAGMSDCEAKALNAVYVEICQKYENMIREKYSIEYGDKYIKFTPKSERITRIDVSDIIRSKTNLYDDLLTITTTWREYCLFLLNTSSEPAKSIWRDKLINVILANRFVPRKCPKTTYLALKLMSEIPIEIQREILEETWTCSDWAAAPYKDSYDISVSKTPQESPEEECRVLINHCLNSHCDALLRSETFNDLVSAFKWSEIKPYSQKTPYDERREYFGYKVDKREVRYDSAAEIGSDEWKERIRSSADIYFKENIHSINNYKGFAVGILKDDIVMKYLGFTPTLRERKVRALAKSFKEEN